MQYNPKVSIIIVSFNQGKFIEEAILSFLNQDYLYKELIIVDGCSTDNTDSIIQKYKNNISCYIREKDRGMYHARNKGIMSTSGDIVGFLNCDDLLESNTLSLVAKEFVSSNAYMVFGLTQAIYEDGKLYNKLMWGHKSIDFSKYFSTMITIPDQSTFYLKDTFSIVGLYDTKLKFGADTDFKCRIISMGLKIAHLNKLLAFWRIHENTLSHNETLKWERLKEAFVVNRRYSKSYFTNYNVRLLYNYLLKAPLKKLLVK